MPAPTDSDSSLGSSCYKAALRATSSEGEMTGFIAAGRTRASWRAPLCCAIASGWLLLCAPHALAAESPPTIDGVSVTNFTESAATIEARINPRGGETMYEIALIWQDAHPPSEGEPLTGGIQSTEIPAIAAGNSDVTVSLALKGLHPGDSYWYYVRAGNRAGLVNENGTTREWFGFHNEVTYPEGSTQTKPFLIPTPLWLVFAVREFAEQVRARERAREEAARVAEAEALKRHEEEVARLVEAAALKRHQEEAAEGAIKPQAPAVACVVPSLKGDTLNTARRALTRHHCRLGKVHRPHHRRGTLLVIAQSPQHGRKLADGALIAVTLGPPHHAR